MSLHQEDGKSSIFSRAGPAIVAAAAALALFAVTLGGTFIYDDFDVFELDSRLREPARWGEYWTRSYNGGVDNLYRPLVSMTYAAQWWLHGADPADAWKFHLVNLLLHAGVAALVAELARRLGGARFGFVAGLLFAVHPIHVEPEANIVGRAELMCAAGTIGALVLLLGPMTTARAVAITLCCIAAILSKEQGILAPLLLLFLAIARKLLPPAPVMLSEAKHLDSSGQNLRSAQDDSAGSRSRRATHLLIVLLTFTLAGYIIWRESILKFWWDRNFLDWTINPLVRPDADRMLMPLVLLGRYFSLLVFPLRLAPDYGAKVIGWTVRPADPYLWLGIVAILLWIGWLILSLRRRNAVAIFALLSLAATYGLVSNFVVLIGTNFAERLMYLPSVFVVMLLAQLLIKLPMRALVPVLIIVLALGSVRSFTYARRWNDRLDFYQTSLSEHPRAIRLHLLLTSEYLSRNQLDRAATTAKRATDELPEYWEVWVSRALVAMEQGRYDDAERFLNVAAATDRVPLGRIAGFMSRLQQRRGY